MFPGALLIADDGSPESYILQKMSEDAAAGGLGMVGAEGKLGEESSTGETYYLLMTNDS